MKSMIENKEDKVRKTLLNQVLISTRIKNFRGPQGSNQPMA